MGVRIYKKNTAARRYASVQDFSDITAHEPKKALTMIKKRSGGRDQRGHIAVQHRGGGAKRYIRIIDWKQNRYDEAAIVQTIEYDPNRGARIALVKYKDGVESYILAPQGIGVGDTVMSSQQQLDVQTGMRVPLACIPIGQPVHNIELVPGRGGVMVRGAGTSAKLQAVEGKYAQLKLPSGEIRLVRKECSATIGIVSNPDWRHIRWGSAGRNRRRGIRPSVRGKVMNPVDHPHGGGEGKNPIGIKKGPKTPWGKPALGVKTRKKHKWSDTFIVRRRAKRGRR